MNGCAVRASWHRENRCSVRVRSAGYPAASAAIAAGFDCWGREGRAHAALQVEAINRRSARIGNQQVARRIDCQTCRRCQRTERKCALCPRVTGFT